MAQGAQVTNVLDHPFSTLAGAHTTLRELLDGRAALLVNVASRCGLTPQYERLEAMQRELGDRGFTVVGFPCNQFAGQEPGTADEIGAFCSATYGVSFPLAGKVEVNGADRDPVYADLVTHPDAAGYAGDIRWNFEKFVVSRDGEVLARFDPRTEPDADEVRAAVEQAIATGPAGR